MKRDFKRTDRLGSQIANSVALILQQEIKAPEIGMVTVTKASVSKDLSHTKIFVSFLGVDEGQESEAIKFLNEQAPLIRSKLGRMIHARVTPELKFLHDDSLLKGQAMDSLLNKIRPSDDGASSDS